jgi:two-component system sensor histidine kinase FlrB
MADDDRRRPIMEKVYQQLHRLNALVTDLLAFARPQTARLATVDLGDLARASADHLRESHPGLVVEVVGSGRAHADANLVQHVLVNLFQNAIHATGEKGAIRVDLDDGQVAVHDSGPGISEEARAKLFEPFFTTKTQGTGLGLAISRKAAQAMGGELMLLHHPALGGASFLLRLQSERSDFR